MPTFPSNCSANQCTIDLSTSEYIYNNLWNIGGATGSQSITALSPTAWTTTWNWTVATEFSVLTYASLVRGWHFGWHFTAAATQLPIAVTSPLAVRAQATWTLSADANCRFDVLWDGWVHSSPPAGAETPTHEILIIPAYTRDLFFSGIYPREDTGVALGGLTWEVIKIEEPGVWDKLVFLIEGSDVTSTDFDFMEFVGYLVTNGYIPNTSYLSSVEFGPEIYKGSGSMSMTLNTVTVGEREVTRLTRLRPGAVPGQRTASGSFSGKAAHTIPGPITQLQPGAFPGQTYGSFARTPGGGGGGGAPDFPPGDLVERTGVKVHALFDLTVSKPTPYTWHLAPLDILTPEDGDTSFDPETVGVNINGIFYQGFIANYSGMASSAAIGGISGSEGVSLTIANSLGSGGPGRRFMDAFATNVPGYSEPYDLLTATLRVKLYWEDMPTSPMTIGDALHIQPDSPRWTANAGEASAVTLTFGRDERRYITLPTKTWSKQRFEHVPDSTENEAMAVWFGQNIRVPLVPLDEDGALWGIGASPADTPINSVSRLWTVRMDPSVPAGEPDQKPTAFPVKITAANEAVLEIASGNTGNLSDHTLKEAAQRFEIDSNGAFIHAVRLQLKRANAGTPCVGSISIQIVVDNDGLPGTTLVDRYASSEISALIVTSGTYADYDIPFQNNNEPRPAYIPPSMGLWVIVKYVKDTSGGAAGNMHLRIDAGGPYKQGVMATRDNTNDADWVLTGKHQRRAPVRKNFQGMGYLFRERATGEIDARAPVKVRR